jgi:DNA-directed RNA polymerase I, II, and III subunit RPABC5
MIVPVRCITCGRVLADKWERFKALSKTNEETNEKNNEKAELTAKTAQGRALDELTIKKYCCRTQMLTTVDMSTLI